MQRFAALLLVAGVIAQITLQTMSARTAAACCCAKMAKGASCPIRARACHTERHCQLQPQRDVAFLTNDGFSHDPAILEVARVSIARHFDRDNLVIARASKPRFAGIAPEPPPPKRA